MSVESAGEERKGRTLCTENLRDAVLLGQERPRLDVLQETPLSLPAHDALQELVTDAPRSEVAELNDDDVRGGVRSSGENEVHV